MTLRDKSRRDLLLLRAQYPVLQSVDLAFTIAPDAVVPRLGGNYRTGIEPPNMPLYVPVIKR